MNGEDIGNYPAFFDDLNHWMTEDDTQAGAAIKAQSGFDHSVSWQRQRRTVERLDGEVSQSSFIDDMWHAYH